MESEVYVCRTCLGREKRENMKSILNDNLHITTYSMKISIIEAFYEITRMIVDTNESITHLICLSCVRRLRQAYLFRVMTSKSYETLCQTNSECIPYKTEDERYFYTKSEPIDSFDDSIDVTTDIVKIVDDNGEIYANAKVEIKEENEMEEQDVNVILTPRKIKREKEIVTKKKTPIRKSTTTIAKDVIICDICSATFTNTRATFIHMKKYHISKKPYKCWYEGCGRLYVSAGQRKAHQEAIHLRLKRFVCDTCGMCFTDNPKLTSHRRVHTGERPYKCDFPGCDAAFKQQFDLVKHKQSIHSTERPFSCEDCGATFKLKGGLRAHRRLMHSRENLKNCSDCDRQFLNAAALNNHYTVIHLGQRNHVCSICSRTYAYRKHLLRHIKDSHPEPYQQMVENGEIVIRMKEQLVPILPQTNENEQIQIQQEEEIGLDSYVDEKITI